METGFLLALPPLAYVAGRLAGALSRRAANRVVAATRLRRSNRVLQAVVALGGLGLATTSPFDDAVAATTPGPPEIGVLVALGASVLGAGVLPALAVHLGTRPAWREIAVDRVDYTRVLRRYAAGVLLVTGPAFIVVGAWVLAPAGLAGIATVVGTALAVVAILPVVVSALGPTRRPTPAEAAILPACARDVHVRVVETRKRSVANALAAGVLPGVQYVFVTDALFDILDHGAAGAVVAHEVGHHERAHVLVRFAATGAALAPLFLVAGGVLGNLVPAVVASVVLLVAAGPVVRWTEFDADAYAATHAEPGAMERALTTLANGGLVEADRSPIARVISLHPSVDRRVHRLRERIGTANDHIGVASTDLDDADSG